MARTWPLAAVVIASAGVADGHPQRHEWRASTYTPSSQDEAALCVTSDGSLFVAWSSRKQQDGRYGVYGQWFDASGGRIGGETPLNLRTDSHQRGPAVACAGPARVWVAWQSHGQDGAAGAIVARLVDRSDAGTTSEVLVNEPSRGHESDPVVAVAADGSAVVAWTTAMPGGVPQVRARRVGVDAIGDELRISVPGRPARGPSVAAARGEHAGEFAVVYAIADQQYRPTGIRLRIYDNEHDRLGEPIDIAGPEADEPIEPAIAATAGGYVAAWLEQGPDGRVVVARRLDERGCPVGDGFVAATAAPTPQSAAAIAVAAGNRIVIGFNAPDDDGLGVYASVLDGGAASPGACFRVNGHTAGRQSMRAASGTTRLVGAGEGTIACAWSGDGGFGDGSSANVTVFAHDPPPVAAAAAIARPHEPPLFAPARSDDVVREVVVGTQEIGFTGVVDSGWTPPDAHMAVGPDHLVLVTNGAIAFFTKDGTQTFQDQIAGPNGFWGELGATGSVFDPETLYDPLSGRFFAMAAEFSAPGPPVGSRALVAVSDDADPNGAWHKYRFDTTALSGATFDSPNMGVDAQALYITGDGFSAELNYPVYIFDKASLLAGDPPLVTNELTIPTVTQSAGLPPVGFDAPPAHYLIEHEELPANTSVRLIALKNPLGTPALVETTLAVPVYGPPRGAPQQGTGVNLVTFDARFWGVAYRNGSLWATHHINDDRVQARWYEIAMNGWPDSGMQPTLVQSGEIDPGPGIHTFHPAITVDDHGNAAMTFSRSAEDEFVSMATAFRYASDPPGTFRPDVIRRTSIGPYTVGRWGDYGAINVDPVDGLTMWANHEYAENNAWRTWVAGFTPVFDPADLDFDGIVGIRDFLILLGQWGPCAAPCPPACAGDIDGSCDVGIEDFLALLAAWS